MAAGEANLAIDDVKAEGDATARLACDRISGLWRLTGEKKTYIAAATAAQSFASSY